MKGIGLFLSALVFSVPACAQENPILIGAAMRSRPAYDGSASQRIDVGVLEVQQIAHRYERRLERRCRGHLER